MCCSALRHTERSCSLDMLEPCVITGETQRSSVLQCVAVCCSVLLCVTVSYSVLQCVAVCCGVLQCVAVCCSVLQCVETHRTKRLSCCLRPMRHHRREAALNCAAVCCGVLQCVAVCCSVSLCLAIPCMAWLRFVGSLK